MSASVAQAVRRGLGDAFWEGDMPALMPKTAARLSGLESCRRGVFKEGEDWTSRLRDLL